MTYSHPLYVRLRRSVTYIILLALLGVVLFNFVCIWTARLLASEGFWLENPTWKGLLLSVQEPAPDVVLVGSSRVQNHFDTRLMSQSGQSFFNYGIPNLFPDEMRPLVERAAEHARSTVVISLPVQSLFWQTRCPKTWSWEDVRFNASYSPRCLEALSANDWFKLLPMNSLLETRAPELQLMPCQRDEHIEELRHVRDILGSDPCADLRRPILLRGHPTRSVLIYANGDGVIVPGRLEEWQAQVTWEDRQQQVYNPDRLKQLRSLLDIVRKHDKQPVLLIEPSPLQPIRIRKDLDHVLGAQTLYLNEWTFADDEIADKEHLGRKGGQRVSAYLAEQLRQPSRSAKAQERRSDPARE